MRGGVETQTFDSPTMSYSAGAIGTFGTSGSVDVTKTGYTPIAATLQNTSGAGAGQATVYLNGNSLIFLLYRTTASAVSNIPVGNWKAIVAYKKN